MLPSASLCGVVYSWWRGPRGGCARSPDRTRGSSVKTATATRRERMRDRTKAARGGTRSESSAKRFSCSGLGSLFQARDSWSPVAVLVRSRCERTISSLYNEVTLASHGAH